MLIKPIRWLVSAVALAAIGAALGAILGLALTLASIWALAGHLSSATARRRGLG